MSIKLSILDQSPISEGSNAMETVATYSSTRKKSRGMGLYDGFGFLNIMTQQHLLGHHLKYSSHTSHLLRLQSVLVQVVSCCPITRLIKSPRISNFLKHFILEGLMQELVVHQVECRVRHMRCMTGVTVMSINSRASG